MANVGIAWVLANRWVQDYKWHYSAEAGRDVGTPATVDRMMARSRELKNDRTVTLDGSEFFPFFSRPEDMGLIGLQVHRESLIEEYLLSQNIPDSNGKNQLEGELRRYVAQITRTAPAEVKLTREYVAQYAQENKLNGLGEKIIAKLGL